MNWFVRAFGTGVVVVAGCLELHAAPAQTNEIPDRPEKLTFTPLRYDPPDPRQFRTTLRSGPVTYLVPDHTLPIVNIVIYLRVGTYLVEQGKEGIADLTGYLLAHGGTEKMTADDLEDRVDFLAAQLDSEIGATHGMVRLNLLAKDLNEGVHLIREVLASPRFEPEKLALRKQQVLQEMQQRNDDAEAIEARELRFLSYGEKFWINRYVTAASLQNVTRDDIKAFHRRWIHPKNFVVAVSGDFPPAITNQLEEVFRDWPFSGEQASEVPTNAVFGKPGLYLVNKDVNQGRVSISLPGIRRDDPDYFPVTVMNDILGGGGFTSRIMNRVRSDEGLAYSAGSSFPGGIYLAAPFTASFQSKSRTVAYATSILLEEIKTITTTSPTEEELTISQQGFVETLPRNFTTKDRVAQVFAEDELTGRFARDPNYWKEYRSRIRAVSKEDVLRVAQKYLDTNKIVVLVVGQKDEILKGSPDHPISLKALIRGEYSDLPLRDPMTMLPIEATVLR